MGIGVFGVGVGVGDVKRVPRLLGWHPYQGPRLVRPVPFRVINLKIILRITLLFILKMYKNVCEHIPNIWEAVHNETIVGTLGCVFIDNESQESGVTKRMTGEAWSAFSWHQSSVFHCQWTHNQVFLLLSHMLIQNAKSILFMWWNMCLVHLKVGN